MKSLPYDVVWQSVTINDAFSWIPWASHKIKHLQISGRCCNLMPVCVCPSTWQFSPKLGGGALTKNPYKFSTTCYADDRSCMGRSTKRPKRATTGSDSNESTGPISWRPWETSCTSKMLMGVSFFRGALIVGGVFAFLLLSLKIVTRGREGHVWAD